MSIYTTEYAYEPYVHEGVKAQTLDTTHERRLEDTGTVRQTLPAFRAPLEEFESMVVELDRDLSVLLQLFLDERP